MKDIIREAIIALLAISYFTVVGLILIDWIRH
jgi:hypothetical protein